MIANRLQIGLTCDLQTAEKKNMKFHSDNWRRHEESYEDASCADVSLTSPHCYLSFEKALLDVHAHCSASNYWFIVLKLQYILQKTFFKVN